MGSGQDILDNVIRTTGGVASLVSLALLIALIKRAAPTALAYLRLLLNPPPMSRGPRRSRTDLDLDRGAAQARALEEGKKERPHNIAGVYELLDKQHAELRALLQRPPKRDILKDVLLPLAVALIGISVPLLTWVTRDRGERVDCPAYLAAVSKLAADTPDPVNLKTLAGAWDGGPNAKPCGGTPTAVLTAQGKLGP